MFVLQDSHYEIVVPSAVYPRALSLDVFSNEAAFFITSNRPLIVLEHPNVYPMKPELTEGEIEYEARGFGTQTLSLIGRLKDADCVTRPPVVFH